MLTLLLGQARTGSPANDVRPLQFVVNPSDYGQPVLHRFSVRDLTLSPDGSEVVFLSAGGISRRPLASLSIHQIPDTRNATGPFISPDGRRVGYHALGEIRKVDLPDGKSAAVAKVSGVFRGATWTSRNTIIFAVEGGGGLRQVSADAGGESRAVTSAQSLEGEHWFPVAVPQTDTVLFTIVRASLADTDVARVDLSNGNVTVLIRGASQAEYSAGHLLFLASNQLYAVPYDAARGVITGERFAINAEFGAGPRGVANFATAPDGTLVYEAQGQWPHRELVWVDRTGKETPTGAPPRPYLFLSLSPDASRVALDVRDGDNDIWVWEFGRRVLSRLTSGPTPEQLPLWSRDGQSIVYSSTQADVPNLWSLRADGGGQPQQLTTGRTLKFADDFSPDGVHLLFRESSQAAVVTTRVLTLTDRSIGETAVANALTRTMNARLSPDGRWVAYQSSESGRNEVYVRPYPDTAGGRWQLSTEGGTQPHWARSGRELFYIALDGGLMSLAIQLTPTLVAARPTRLLTQVYHTDPVGRSYEPSPDGQRFLMIKSVPGVLDDGLMVGALAVVQRWRMLVAPAR